MTVKKHQYTSMSRTCFLELRAAWSNGSLQKKWNDIQAGKVARTVKDNVEERQIRVMALALQLPDNKYRMLILEKWRELVVLQTDDGKFELMVYS